MVAVKVPATSANLGPGFDTLGLALNLYLNVEIDFADSETTIYFEGEGQDFLQNNLEDNLVLNGARRVLEEAGISQHLNININNEIPVGKGLGSSAAAIVAGLFSANQLINNKFTQKQLIKWAVEMEGHADNIIPAVIGGLATVMMYTDEVYYQRVKIPENIDIIVAVPDFKLSTEKSRAVIPDTVSLKDTVYNLQRASYLIASLNNKDYAELDKAMDDLIYQPLRKKLIPGFDSVFEKAKNSGAIGVALSGAGPSIIAFASSNVHAIGDAMRQGFKESGVNNKIYYLKPSINGLVSVK